MLNSVSKKTTQFKKIMGSILEPNLCLNFKFCDIFGRYLYNTYNTQRARGSILRFAPTMFWALFKENKIEIEVISKSELKFTTKESKQSIRFNKTVKKVSNWVMRA
ncbi:MAG: hypothetical protein WAU01_17435 [Saprospiraceae bacterium]